MPATTITHSEVVTKTLTKVERPSPIPAHQPSAPVTGNAKEIWAAPTRYSNLSSFKITKYPGPEQNLKIVTGIPAQASAHPDSDFSKASSKKSKKKKGKASTTRHFGSPGWDNDTSIIQIFYPKGSINPAREPQGGAEFYGSPVDISDASSVTFEYSVFFPADFDWVKAGKLPGLYGGHPGCSGGNAALDCFSTRLMWRKDGQGELYLYAPKDKQTKALCDDPLSTCDAAYGLSIGRGSFGWAAGAWTTARQTIVLNTPGKTNGVFTLDVNGERVIDRNDIMYRDRIPPSKTATKKPSKATKTTTSSASSSTDGDGLLGPIVSGILGGSGIGDVGSGRRGSKGKSEKSKREVTAGSSIPAPLPRQNLAGRTAVPGSGVTEKSPIQTRDVQWIRRGAKARANNHGGGDDDDNDDEGQVKLVGIFFSTFFGGHEDEYATPKDQYTWFKDFKLTYND
ncbi:hypothetical protein BJ165DRAFT_1354279 [Panaeolus papilionaceus]|nr:hypothetical protein BJ165DRAFT_1354279 [Panaeolus papilionaceus]